MQGGETVSTKELFPMTAIAGPTAAAEDLPLYRDIAWDMEADAPRFTANGEPVMAEGLEALKGWARNAVRTERYRWEIYEFSFGSEINRLVGQPYSADTKLSEATRYLTEALQVNPYIKAVQVRNAVFQGSVLSADIIIETVYGEASVHV